MKSKISNNNKETTETIVVLQTSTFPDFVIHNLVRVKNKETK